MIYSCESLFSQKYILQLQYFNIQYAYVSRAERPKAKLDFLISKSFIEYENILCRP